MSVRSKQQTKDLTRPKERENKFRGNSAFFIPITEIPHFITGLNDRQEAYLKRAIEVLTTTPRPEDKVFFLGEIALMPKPSYASNGFFKRGTNTETPSTTPQYNIHGALGFINTLMKNNGFGYGEARFGNAWAELKDIKKTKQESGKRRSDAVREYLIEHFGDDELNQGLKNKSTPSIDPPEGTTLKLEFRLSAEQGDFFQDKKNVAKLTGHADNPVKLLITKAFLHAMQSDIPTDVMHKEYFIDLDIPPVVFKEKGNVLTVEMELPALFAGLVKDNLNRHPEKFEATQEAIGREIALAMSIQRNVRTLQITA